MCIEWLERYFTFRPDAEQYASLSPFSFECVERGDSTESTIVYSKIKENRPVLVFAHGNTGNVSRCTWYFEQFEKLNLSYVAFDYPGYDRAKGLPSEASFYRSGETVVTYLREEKGIEPKDIILYGVSLGGGIAVELATKYPFSGMVLECVFTDSHEMGKRVVPYLPISWLLPNRFNNRKKIEHTRMPLFLIHGGADETTPVAMGLEIFDRHPGPKEKLIVEGAGHREVGRGAGEIFLNRLLSFIQNVYEKRTR